MGSCTSKSLHKLQKEHNPASFTEPDPPQDKLIISQSFKQTWSSSTPTTSSSTSFSSSSSSSSIFTCNSSHYSSSNANRTPQITILDPHKPNSSKLRPTKQSPLPSKRSSSAQPASFPRNNNNNYHSNLKKKYREAPHVSITANACKKVPAKGVKKPNPLPSKRSSSSAQPASLPGNNNHNNHSNLKQKLTEAPPVSIAADTCEKVPVNGVKKPNPLPSKRPSSSAQPASLPRNNNNSNNDSNLKKKLREAPPVTITADTYKKVPVNGIKKPSPLPSKRSSSAQPVSLHKNNNNNNQSNLNEKFRAAHPVSIPADSCKKVPANSLKKPNPLPSKRSSSAQGGSLPRNNNNNNSDSKLEKELREAPLVSITANTYKQAPANGFKKKPSPLALNAGKQVTRSRKDEGRMRSSVRWGATGEVVISICTAGFPPYEDFDHPLVSMDCFIFV